MLHLAGAKFRPFLWTDNVLIPLYHQSQNKRPPILTIFYVY